MLLSAEENTADLVEAPTEEEMNTAITKNISHAITVVGFAMVLSNINQLFCS